MSNIRPELRALAVPITSVHPYATNPNRGDVGTLADSLTLNGQYRAVLRWKQTGEALLGNTTLAAALSLGWTEIAVRDIDCTETQARKIVAVDNRAADRGGYDETALALQLGVARDSGLLGTGFTDFDVDELLSRLDADNTPPDPAGGMDGNAGALREISLAYPTDGDREEFLAHVTRLAAAWDVGAHSAQIVLRALELARV